MCVCVCVICDSYNLSICLNTYEEYYMCISYWELRK